MNNEYTINPLVEFVPERELQWTQFEVYPGIGRLVYGLGQMGNGFIYGMTSVLAQGYPSVQICLAMMAASMSTALLFSRLQNTGKSGWWALLTWIPIIGFLVGIPCLCAPPGYFIHRKMDTAAWILMGLWLATVAAFIGYVIWLYAPLILQYLK